MDHTPEPWVVCGYGDSILNDDCEGIVHVSYENGPRDANLRRIVACVNACVGITTESLEKNSVKQMAPLLAVDLLMEAADE